MSFKSNNEKHKILTWETLYEKKKPYIFQNKKENCSIV